MVQPFTIIAKLPGLAQYKPFLSLYFNTGKTLHCLDVANQGSNPFQIKTIRRITEDGKVEPCKYGINNTWTTSPVVVAPYTAANFIIHLGPKYYMKPTKFGYLISLTDRTVFFKNNNLSYAKCISPSIKALLTELLRGRFTF
jgi:hypothetical protein